MANAMEARVAESVVKEQLTSLLGATLPGVNAFGVSFDWRSQAHFVRVQLDPSVPERIRRQIPDHVSTVPVHVQCSPMAEME